MKKLLLLLLAMVPVVAFAQQPIQRNDVTTNTLSVAADAVVTINAHIPLGVATTHTNAYLMRRFGGPTFFDVRLFDNGLVMSAAYASNAPPVITGITNSTDVVGIGDFALDSLVGDGLLNIYGYGPSALAGATLAPFSSQIFSYGESALSGSVISNAVSVYAFGASAGSSMAGDGLSTTYLFGHGAFQGGVVNNGVDDVYALGKSALDSANIDSSSVIYVFGDNAMNSVVMTNSDTVFAIGPNTLQSATVDNGSSGIFAFGGLGDSAKFDGVSVIYGIGDSVLNSAVLSGAGSVFSIGVGALDSAMLTNSTRVFAIGVNTAASLVDHDGATDIYAFGTDALSTSTLTNSTSQIYAVGNSALQGATLDGSSGIYAFGGSALLGVSLTNASDVYAFGANTLVGSGFPAQVTHVFLLGSGAQATNSNDYVFGDSAYNYFFPGASATFANYVSLSGNTNRYTDDGSTLLRNGVAIAGGDTTGTNVVTLTQTGTNVSSMNFALVQNGGLFKIALTNNAFMPTPSNVAAGRHAWLAVQQPSTGTCLVTWTNGTFNGPEGQLLINDTNNGAVVYYEMVSDAFTNGVVNLWMSTRMARMP